MRIEVNEEEAVYLLNNQKDEIQSLKSERDQIRRDLEKARTVARRLYHDWNSRTVRSLQEIADENPWIVENLGS